MLRIAFVIALAASACVMAVSVGATEPPSLHPAGVRGVRYLMRDDARSAAVKAGVETLLNWYEDGLTRPGEMATLTQVRTAFEGNAIRAERQFARSFVVTGTLHSIARRADQQIAVRFVEGGLADSQRRGLSGLGLKGNEIDSSQFLGGITGGRMHAGAIAVLSSEHEDAVASWEPGVMVTLHCSSATNVPLAVLLDNCVPQASVLATADRLADAQSDLAIARRPLTTPPMSKRDDLADPVLRSRFILALGYVTGLAAQGCPDADIATWVKCSQNILNRKPPSAQEIAAWQQAARDLDMPGLAAPPKSQRPAPARRN